jgi:hypothetical protein
MSFIPTRNYSTYPKFNEEFKEKLTRLDDYPIA